MSKKSKATEPEPWCVDAGVVVIDGEPVLDWHWCGHGVNQRGIDQMRGNAEDRDFSFHKTKFSVHNGGQFGFYHRKTMHDREHEEEEKSVHFHGEYYHDRDWSNKVYGGVKVK